MDTVGIGLTVINMESVKPMHPAGLDAAAKISSPLLIPVAMYVSLGPDCTKRPL